MPHTDLDTRFALRRLANAVRGSFLALGALALPVDQILVVRRLFRAQCQLRLQRRVWPVVNDAVEDGPLDAALKAHFLGAGHLMANGAAMLFSVRRPLRLFRGEQQAPKFLHSERFKTASAPCMSHFP